MKGHYHKGYDIFYIKQEKKEEMHCRVCGAKCEVSRDIEGAVSMATSMAGIKVKHDQFSCPNYDKDWHYKAYKLIREIEETHSKRLKELIRKDLNEILEKNMR